VIADECAAETNSLVYNIPVTMMDAYRGRNVILRSSSARELAECFLLTDASLIRFVQLVSLDEDVSPLEGAGVGIPLEVSLQDTAHYERLYRLVNLLDSHPVRIAIPVVSGFNKAVKLAISLNFAVKLELGQPDDSLLNVLESVLDSYLHHSYVRQPIEFFHTTLISFYLEQPTSLWDIAEENPAQLRYITDENKETISPRFAGSHLNTSLANFVEEFSNKLVSEKRECYDCQFFDRCKGYFKWPNSFYSCSGIKKILGTLQDASQEVKQDLANYRALGARA